MKHDTQFRGRPGLAAIAGLFVGLFAGLDLVFFGVMQLDNIALTVLPILGVFLGVGLAMWAPFGRKRVVAANKSVV